MLAKVSKIPDVRDFLSLYFCPHSQDTRHTYLYVECEGQWSTLNIHPHNPLRQDLSVEPEAPVFTKSAVQEALDILPSCVPSTGIKTLFFTWVLGKQTSGLILSNKHFTN